MIKIGLAPNTRTTGFTLVELLVSMAVLSLLVLVVAQLSGLTTQNVTEGLRRADHFAKGRSALDLFVRDLNDGVFRSDLPAFRDANGSFAMTFFVRRPGIGGDRPLSLVAYETDPDEATLLRGSLPVLWDDATALGFGSTGEIPAESRIGSTDTLPIASGVVQMELFFLNGEGIAEREFSADTRAIGVAMVIADSGALEALQISGNLAALRNRFPAQTQEPLESYEKFWQPAVEDLAADNQFSPQVARGIRIFQRVAPITR